MLVDANSDPDSIRYLQEQLVYLGYLDGADGVYGPATTQAITNFQHQVNADLGYEALTPNGVFTARTQNYLEKYVYRAMMATETPTQAPTGTPTPVPISAPSISATANGYDDGGVFVFDGDASFHWTVEGEVASFSAVLYDSQGNIVRSGGVNGNSLTIGAAGITPGEGYTLEVIAQPAGGEPTSARFPFRIAVPATEAPTEAPTPQPISAPSISAAASGHDEGGVYVFDGSAVFQWSVDGNADGYTVTLYDASGALVNTGNVPGNGIDLSGYNITPGVDYTLEVVAHAADGGADTSATFTFRVAVPVTEAPTPQPISAPSIGAAASGYDEGGVYVFDGDPTFQWSVQGDVARYVAAFYAPDGSLLHSMDVNGTTASASMGNFTPGTDYTLEVTAYPADGGEPTSATFTFRVAVPVTEAPTPQPIPAPSIGAAASGHEEGGVYVFDGSAAFQWSVDGNVGGYTVTLYDASGALVNTGNVPGNGIDLSGYNIIPGVDYTLEVVAHPADGGADTSSTITFRIAGADMPAIIDRNSDPESIAALQEKLFNLGMFTEEDAPQRGVFDQRTLEIVLGFQQAYNAQNPGAPLVEIDPTDPNTVIDATTLALIMNAEVPQG